MTPSGLPWVKVKVKLKLKQSDYRSVQAPSVPGG